MWCTIRVRILLAVLLLPAFFVCAMDFDHRLQDRVQREDQIYSNSQVDLWDAVESNDISAVGALLDKGVSLDDRTNEGCTVLHFAVLLPDGSVCLNSARCAMLRYLIQRGADVNACAMYGITPLHCAAVGRPEILAVLLTNGAQVAVRSDAGHTPLHYAAHEGAKSIARILLAAGACRGTRDNDGRTPQYYAITAGADHELIRELRPGVELDPFEDASVLMGRFGI